MSATEHTGYAKEWTTPAAIAARQMSYRWTESDERRDVRFLLTRVGLQLMSRNVRDLLISLSYWLTLADLKNGETIVDPANEWISGDLGLGERSVQQTLSDAERDGWLFRDWTVKHRRVGGGAGINLAPLYCRLCELQSAFDCLIESRRSRLATARPALIVDNTLEERDETAAETQSSAPLGESACTLNTDTADSSLNLDGCRDRQQLRGGDNLHSIRRPRCRPTEPPAEPDAAFARLRAVMRAIEPDYPLRRSHSQPAKDAAVVGALELAVRTGARRHDVIESIRQHGALAALAALVVVRLNVAQGKIKQSAPALATTLLREASNRDLWRTINQAATATGGQTY